MTIKKETLMLPQATEPTGTTEAEILEKAKEILNKDLPESELAPHGRDENGKPLAPFGLKKGTNLPRKERGRPWDKEKNRDKPKDERELLKEIETPDLSDYKAEPVTDTPPEAQHIPIEDIIDKPEPTPAPAAPEPTLAATQKNKVYISGAMFLFALDLIIPKSIEFVYSFLGLEFTDSKSIRLDENEKKDLRPMCDEVVNELLASLTPLQQFMLYTGIIYGSKISFAETKRKQKKTKQPIKKA
jgi:hypothetical protein